MRIIRTRLAICALLMLQACVARPCMSQPQSSESTDRRATVRFDLDALQKVPETHPLEESLADQLQTKDVQAFYYSGPPYQGRHTRVFAYYAAPKPALKPAPESIATRYPAVVLVHGGGGTAFDRWVRLWNERGYAAIAMDLCGCVPVGSYGKWQRHEQGGPPGWDASFTQLDQPLGDQWTMQAVSAIALAHSLIRSFPEVDPERIGVTGISWGGYLTCITAGVDHRFRAAVPVYGCGYLGDNSAWLPAFERMGRQQAAKWLAQWDPAVYLPEAKMPMLWVNGTNDFAYPMDSWQKSYRLPKGDRTLCLRIRMPHGHGAAGENPEEIHTFMNSVLTGGAALPRFVSQTFRDGQASAQFHSDVPLEKAELCWTHDSGKWTERKWEASAAELDLPGRTIRAAVPEEATAFYLNLFDQRGNAVSTEHQER